MNTWFTWIFPLFFVSTTTTTTITTFLLLNPIHKEEESVTTCDNNDDEQQQPNKEICCLHWQRHSNLDHETMVSLIGLCWKLIFSSAKKKAVAAAP